MCLCVAGHRQIEALLRFKESIREDDVFEEFQLGILTNLRINVEEHRHVHLLVRIQLLLLETEALDFVEIRTRFEWDDVVGTNSNHRLICWVPGSVKGQGGLSGKQLK